MSRSAPDPTEKEAPRPVSPRRSAPGAPRGGASDHPGPWARPVHACGRSANGSGCPGRALYRHFSDKQALLAAVGREGFRTLRVALQEAWERNGRGRSGFEAMAIAYVQFAVTHPAHYRVMFGRFVESCEKDTEFMAEATAAFQVLVDSLVEQQQAGSSGATIQSCWRGSSGRSSTASRCSPSTGKTSPKTRAARY